MTIDLNPFSSLNLDDPHPCYAALRDDANDFVEIASLGVLVAARHDVCRAVLRDHDTYLSGLGVQWTPVADAGTRATFIENDPPAHTRVRRSVQRWATPRAIANMADYVDEVVEELVDELVTSGGGDAMTMLARPTPLRVMSRWLGVDLPDDAIEWADASFRLGAPEPSADAATTFAGFLNWLLGDGLTSVRPGSFAEAILAGGDNDGLVDDEPFIALASIIIAGLDTTVHMIGNGLAALADNPDQLSVLQDDPAGLAPNAVEEILRFDSPVRFFLRRTQPDSGSDSSGKTVVVLYGSANRDERVFTDANRFDITRDASAQLAFGAGIHLCLGAPLARLEGAAILRAFADRVASVEVLTGAQRTNSGAIRGFAQLPIRVTPRKASLR